MLNTLKRYYNLSPTFIKRMYSNVPLSVRMGRAYRQTRALLQYSQGWSADEFNAYQSQQISLLLAHAYNNVPFYRTIFDKFGFKPRSFQNTQQMRDLPTLTKIDVKTHYDRLIARNISPYERHYFSTGGTTGEPLQFLVSNTAYFTEWAFIHDMWSRIGFRPRDTRMALREFPFRTEKPYYYNPIYNELLLSTLAMSDKNLALYAQEARRIGASFIHGYPSAISIFARYVERSGQRIPSLKAVLAGSEATFPWQRALFEKVFECRVFTWYGQSERVVLAGECEHDRHYHVYPQYGFLELLDAHDQVISEPGIVGEIVGTGFLNYAMPFIRYRTGDYAEYVAGRCSCGRNYPLLKSVVGRRRQDFLVGREKQIVPATSFYLTDWALLRNVHEFQLEQHVEGKVIVKVVPTPGFSKDEEGALVRAMTAWARNSLEFDIVTVENLKRTSHGKVQFVIQNLDVAM